MISKMFERTVDKPIDPHIFRTVGPVTHSRPRLAIQVNLELRKAGSYVGGFELEDHHDVFPGTCMLLVFEEHKRRLATATADHAPETASEDRFRNAANQRTRWVWATTAPGDADSVQQYWTDAIGANACIRAPAAYSPSTAWPVRQRCAIFEQLVGTTRHPETWASGRLLRLGGAAN
jgi:hypothetical protein